MAVLQQDRVIRGQSSEGLRMVRSVAHLQVAISVRDFLAMATQPFPVLCDLDGVIWLAHQPIEGSARAVSRLRDAGHRVLFVTNNSASVVADQQQALEHIGIPADGDVLTSAMAAALLVQPGDHVLVCGGPGIVEALNSRGAVCAVAGPFDAVMVGFHRTFNYEVMRVASDAARAGARLLATNDDATYPTPDGLIPGGGAILAGIAVASGMTPIVAGKPYGPMADLVRRELGGIDMSSAVMVGDRPETDGLFARTLGCRYAHVWSGVTPHGTDVVPIPDLTGANLAAIADALLR